MNENRLKVSRFRIGVFFGLAITGALAIDVGCSSSSDSAAPVATEAGGDDGQAASDVVVPTDSPTGPQVVTFAYKPQWSGVTKVEVVGGFGTADDWSKTTSFLTLSDDGTGNYTGSSTLAAGQYLYVFRVTGDNAAPAAGAATYQRYAVDPYDTAFAPCPATSPTYSKIDVNPCSQVSVPTSPPAAAIHIKGSLTVDGAAANGWLVEIERDEPMSHHFFVNRITTTADGSFDVIGSAGNYRLQVLHPTYLNQTDLDLVPTALNVLRRAISNTIPLATADVSVTAPDLAFHSYATYAPTGSGGTLPTAFTFQASAGVKLDVYGATGGDGGVSEIGDPWFSSKPTDDGGASFDGEFNTAQAEEDAAVTGRRYMWGTEQAADASIVWTKQTMVYPITWQ